MLDRVENCLGGLAELVIVFLNVANIRDLLLLINILYTCTHIVKILLHFSLFLLTCFVCVFCVSFWNQESTRMRSGLSNERRQTAHRGHQLVINTWHSVFCSLALFIVTYIFPILYIVLALSIDMLISYWQLDCEIFLIFCPSEGFIIWANVISIMNYFDWWLIQVEKSGN